MTRRELVERLSDILAAALETGNQKVGRKVAELKGDVENDGVLDVQCPADIAEWMDLPRPAK